MDSPHVKVAPTDRGFDYWLANAPDDDELRTSMARADVLIVPWLGFRDHPGPVLPQGTDQLFHTLREKLPALHVEAAVAESDYREVVLHSDLKNLPEIIVNHLFFAELVRIIGGFLIQYLGDRLQHTIVRSKITVQDTDGSRKRMIKVEYEGPADTFESTMNAALKASPNEQPLPSVSPEHPPTRSLTDAQTKLHATDDDH